MFEQLTTFLEEQGIDFRTLEHAPTLTSEDSARERGEDISIGGKALLLKIDDRFHLFVLSAARKLDSKAIKKYMKAKKIRFATREELMDMTGLVPGSVPPFGRPLIDFDLYVDESIMQNERIAFNAGSLTKSVIMPVKDYSKVAHPQVFSFSK